MMTAIREFYWIHRAACLLGGSLALAFLLAQVALCWWMSSRLREVAHLRERLSRLADGLALLTDTTESGIAAIVREMHQAPARAAAAPRASRTSVNKRVVSAARKGLDLGQIAEREALSESEVRLHLKLAEARRREASLEAGR